MADWRRLARELLLADGKIDERESAVVRRELFADHKLDDLEIEFLLDLKKGATGVSPAFNRLVLDAIKQHLLEDGVITPAEATWLRRWVLADGKVIPPVKQLLQELKTRAKKTCPEFDALYQKCMTLDTPVAVEKGRPCIL
jgi:hypothetical protein